MIRILLLDDHPVLRHGVRAVLDTQDDLEVIADVGTVAEAAAAADGIDVALVDLDLGDDLPDGIDAIRAIRAANPKTQVLVFTAYDSDADIVRALDAGAAGYLVKDSRPAELFRAIRTAARGAGQLDGPIGERLLERIDRPEEALTARELEVLALAANGHSNRDLARELHLSEATVKTHLHHAFTKLGADNRQAAISVAIKRGIIRL
ncbi:response regulator [uncultured Microbacterium sp.]|uniref:response regulator n=1 Tax=uncultured Microbacterium sp. TaxID=191216 RepID=UPI00261298CC|nr:response regulator transcription factor [uncultured Microbacterium sp.]